ncbi:MAG: phosphate/phosphite/phosphonate ABC transporter substrate-binding protein [Myxococcota bacterium]
MTAFFCRAARTALLGLTVACTAETGEQPTTATEIGSTLDTSSAVPEERIRFSVPPIAAEAVMRREYQPLATYLARRLDTEVELVIPDDYEDATDRVAKGSVDVAMLSPLAYVLTAERVQSLRIVATLIAQGSPTYASYIIVREDSKIEDIDGLAGKNIAFVDRRSTSGFLYPYAYLLERQIDPEKYFGSIEFLGNHSAVIDALRTKQVDAGATFAAASELLEGDNAVVPDLRILAKTGRIPYDAVVATAEVSDVTVRKMRQALLALSTRSDEGRRILRSSSGINGFLAADDGHYDEVRRVLKRVGPTAAVP